MKSAFRVACVGNMNNNSFVLARLLRRRGIDADCLRFPNEPGHFDPLCDTFDETELRFVRTLPWGDASDVFKFSPAELRKDLEDYDFVIGNGLTPAFFARMGRQLDIFSPYGSDLYETPFHSFWRHPRGYFVSRLQRQGIRAARLVHAETEYYNMGPSLKRIGPRGKILSIGLAAIDEDQYDPSAISKQYSKSKFYPQFKSIRDSSHLMIYHQARHLWKNPEDGVTFKGTDRLLLGFAEFLRRHPESKATLVTFEYGQEVDESKKLISELGIDDSVVWMPLMDRKELMVGLSLCDIGTGEFHTSCLGAGVIFETLALAKPLMHYRVDSDFAHAYPTLYPILNASSPEDIHRHLSDYWKNPEPFKEIGRQGRNWLIKELNDRVIDAYIDQMNRVQQQQVG